MHLEIGGIESAIDITDILAASSAVLCQVCSLVVSMSAGEPLSEGTGRPAPALPGSVPLPSRSVSAGAARRFRPPRSFNPRLEVGRYLRHRVRCRRARYGLSDCAWRVPSPRGEPVPDAATVSKPSGSQVPAAFWRASNSYHGYEAIEKWTCMAIRGHAMTYRRGTVRVVVERAGEAGADGVGAGRRPRRPRGTARCEGGRPPPMRATSTAQLVRVSLTASPSP